MDLLGLHTLDVLIIAVVLIAMLIIGMRLSRRSKRESDFFVGGRKLGALLQFFLNFGMMADTNEASIIGTEVYRQGAAGMWIGFQALIATPFFWFTPVWFRRTRLITYADLFKDRFNSSSLTVAYAAIQIVVLTLTLALGNLISFKMASAMLIKPESRYTQDERASIDNFRAYERLKESFAAGTLQPLDQERFNILRSLADRGELGSYISYLKPLPFYLTYSAIIASYLLFGGLTTVAILDGLQSGLIILISVLLLPFGLSRLGGLSGLHHALPAHMFDLFGSAELSDYTWFTILAIVLNCIVVIPSSGGPGNASGKTERAIRTGTLTAAFTKRLVMIAWMFAALIAAAIFQRGLSNPENAWGLLSNTLLPTGLIGLMFVGMFVGHMPNVGFTAINISALFTRNLYHPLVPNRQPAHYLLIAKLIIILVLGSAALIPLFFSGVIAILTTTLTFSAFFGAVGYLIYFWRKLTVHAIWISMIIWIILIGILPWTLPQFESFRTSPALLAATTLSKTSATPLFFDHIVRIHPTDTSSILEGTGRFNMENYLLYHIGLPLDHFTSAGLVASRWYFDSIFPFICLMVLSQIPFKRQSSEQQAGADIFFAKLRTPVGQTPAEEEQEMQLTRTDPARFNNQKLFLRSNWEFSKWTKADYQGFTLCWCIVVAILGLLLALLHYS